MPVLRHRFSRAHRVGWQHRRARSRGDPARHSGRRARMAERRAPGALPKLQCDLPARRVAAGAELPVLRLGATRCVCRDQGGVSPGKRAAVQDFRTGRARRHPRVVRATVAGAVGIEASRAHRHRRRRLPAVLDVRCAGRSRMDRGGGALLPRKRNGDGQRTAAYASGATHPLGAGGRARRAFLR